MRGLVFDGQAGLGSQKRKFVFRGWALREKRHPNRYWPLALQLPYLMKTKGQAARQNKDMGGKFVPVKTTIKIEVHES